MPNLTQDQQFQDAVAQLSKDQLRSLGDTLAKLSRGGMDQFDIARREAIAAYFQAKQLFTMSKIHPNYQYRYQEYPAMLYAVVVDDEGQAMIVHHTVKNADEAEALGEDFHPSPAKAVEHFTAKQAAMEAAEKAAVEAKTKADADKQKSGGKQSS